MRVLVTGARGFLGKNLTLRLAERTGCEVRTFTRDNSVSELPAMLASVDGVVHLAGVNRPPDPGQFEIDNVTLTRELVQALREQSARSGRRIPVIFSSSVHAGEPTPYGESKRRAETILLAMARELDAPVYVFRLPHVFGKWCKPNYNSVVATFSHNIARGLTLQIDDEATVLRLVYVDDVIDAFIAILEDRESAFDLAGYAMIEPQYELALGELAEILGAFHHSRDSLVTERVGRGLLRTLYATYASHLPKESFTYGLRPQADARGVFVEVLKTVDSGQFSCFTVRPGKTRGGHYHHTKTEKFLVLRGTARFRFRHMGTGDVHEVLTSGDKAEIVETVPGWVHDITNTGDEELIVVLWASEVFDPGRPDTYVSDL